MSQSVTWGTIRTYLSGLRFHQIRSGLPDPALSTFPRLTYVLKGIHRQHPDRHQKHRLPITMPILLELHRVWSEPPIQYNSIMLWAACCLGFFGFLRAGEFTCTSALAPPPLLTTDVSVDSHTDPQLMVIHLRSSKTDPFGVGCRIYLGRTHTTPCPVSAVLTYISIRTAPPGPLFLFQDGTPLTRAALVTHLRAALSQAGVDSSPYSGHSFRIGAATTAARAGYQDSFIQTLGRWKSAAFITYIRTSPSELAAVSTSLARKRPNL